MSLTAAHINQMTHAAGAYGGMVASAEEIANLFNEAIETYGGGHFNTKERVAALVSECLMESAYWRTTVEYANTGPYQPYRGRTFIQITWKDNYASFGKWCKDRGLISDANYFVNHPVELGRLEWAALGGVWYFTTRSWGGKYLYEFSNSIEQVGKAVNMGSPYSPYTPNGMSARRRAYDAVLSLGNSIVPTAKAAITQVVKSEPEPTTPKPNGVPIMAKPNKWRRTKSVKYKKDSGWHMLPINDKTAYSLASGPGTIYATVDLNVSAPCVAQFRTVNKSKSGKVANATVYEEVKLKAGGNQLVFYDTIGGPGKGYDQKYVRVYIKATNAITVRHSRTRAGKEES